MHQRASDFLRKWVSLFLLAAIVLSAFPAFPAFAASGVRYVSTENGGCLNMRDKAGRKGSVILRLPVGTEVTLREEGETWSKISFGGKIGYVMTRYLTEHSNGKAKDGWASVSRTMYVETANKKPLHLREKASRSSKSLGLFQVGTKVSVSALSSSWAKVRVGEQEGYMMLTHLTEQRTADNDDTGHYYIRGTGSVAMYREADAGSQVLLRVPGGSRVNVYKQSGKWTQTTVQGMSGYVATAALTRQAPDHANAKSATVINPNGASYVNLRSTPAKKDVYNVLAHIRVNTRVQLLGKSGSWRRIAWGDLVGYVHHTFLEVDE